MFFKLNKRLLSLNRLCRSFGSDVVKAYNHIYIYNTLSKAKEQLKLHNSNVLYWYICGPTVYDYAHIGHASCYMNFDIIKKILKNYFHVNVVDLMNITDIDDKIITKAKQENKTYNEISKFYENDFYEDLLSLNIDKPSITLRVTDNIEQIIGFIQKLIDVHYAYKTDSGCVYFNTKAYDKNFFVNNQSKLIELDIKEKQNPTDFALWKAKKYDYEPSWSSPWGNGRPGWHIECSTLANIAFNDKLDFHSGGKDLIFPHHENESLQCCAYHNTSQWSTHWIHSGLLNLKDVKMSKSLKNTITIKDLLKTYKSNEFRLFCLLSHYRNDKDYSEEQMRKPIAVLNTIKSFVEIVQAYCNGQLTDKHLDIDDKELFDLLATTKANIHAALCDDFNTSIAMNELLNLIGFINKLFQPKTNQQQSLYRHYGPLMATVEYTKFMLKSFGFTLQDQKQNSQNDILLNKTLESSLKFRSKVRTISKTESISKEIKKDLLNACDEYRSDLKLGNISIKDYKDKTIWAIDETK